MDADLSTKGFRAVPDPPPGAGRRQGMPRGAPRGRGDGGGFTVVEILVAFFIFSIIASTVFGSFRYVFGKADLVDAVVREEERARTCLDRMTRDLVAIHVTPAPAYRAPELTDAPDPYRVAGENVAAAGREFSRLRFVSREHLSFGTEPREGLAEIVYYVTAAEGDRWVLRRSDRLDFEEDFEENPMDPVLHPSVGAVTFGYMDAEGEWHETWDSDAEDVDHATPRAVRVELKTGEGGGASVHGTVVFLPVHRDGAP